MKSVRINLMNRTEVRYQGTVSPKFLAIALGSTLVSVIVLLLVVQSVQYTYRKKHLANERNVWSTMEPRYRASKKARAELSYQKNVLAALEAYEVHAAKWGDFLLTLQETIPAEIQLGYLQLVNLQTVGAADPARFLIKGWSQGDDAEGVVIEWRKSLLADPVYTNQFDSLELSHLRLAGNLKGDVVRRSFELKGTRELAVTNGGKK